MGTILTMKTVRDPWFWTKFVMNMDHKKKHRKVLRTSFTKAANELEDLFSTEDVDSRLANVSLNILQQKIESVNSGQWNLLVAPRGRCHRKRFVRRGRQEWWYKWRYSMIEILCQEFLETSYQQNDASSTGSEGSHNSGRHSLKLLTLEFRKFSGELRGLPFWA